MAATIQVKAQSTVQGLDHYRSEFEGEFDGNTVKGVTVLNGEKGWRNFGDTHGMDEDGVANEKRTIYLAVVPATLVPLKGKEFKIEPAGEEKVGDKPAVAIKVTGPDGKDFKLFFDKESGLPVRLEAKVVGFEATSSRSRRPIRITRTSTASRRPPRSRASATARSSSNRRSPNSRSGQSARRHFHEPK